MVDLPRIELEVPTPVQVLVTGVLIFMAGMIAGAGIVTLIWSPP